MKSKTEILERIDDIKNYQSKLDHEYNCGNMFAIDYGERSDLLEVRIATLQWVLGEDK